MSLGFLAGVVTKALPLGLLAGAVAETQILKDLILTRYGRLLHEFDLLAQIGASSCSFKTNFMHVLGTPPLLTF